MIKKIIKTIEQHKMVLPGEKILVGVSGGADSMVLLNILITFGYTVCVVHINHMLRGAESLRDESFVKSYCQQNKIEYESFCYDIKSEAQQHGTTIEEQGRQRRYEAFGIASKKLGAQKIAVAHNLNDQAETVLLRLFRGTGIKGLTAIPPVRQNIIRPLIDVTRSEIELYAAKNNIQYINDSSNQNDDYARNKIRNNIIPWIKQHFNASFEQAIFNLISSAALENNYLEAQAQRIYDSALIKNDSICLSIPKALEIPELTPRVLRLALEKGNLGLKDVSYKNITDIINTMHKSGSKKICIAKNIIAEKNYDYIVFYKKMPKHEQKEQNGFVYKVEIDKQIYIHEIKKYIFVTKDKKKLRDDIYTKCFDYDTMKGTIEVRSKRSGDKIFIKGVGTKKLSDYFIDKKIPKGMRSQIPVFTCDNNIFWIVGHRCAKSYEPTKTTKQLLYFHIYS